MSLENEITFAPEVELAKFATDIICSVGFPVLAEGYTQLVSGLRKNESLAQHVKQVGLTAVLDSQELPELRKNNKELVTSAEKEAEALMAAEVLKQYPAHAIVGEEHGYRTGSSTRWVFDPIDGTSAMIRTAMMEALNLEQTEGPKPAFGITVGITEGDVAILGAVAELQPRNGSLELVRLWVGGRNVPVTCNGQLVSKPDCPNELSGCVLASTVPEIMFSSPEKWSGFQALLQATDTSCVTGQNCIGFMRLLEAQSGINIVYEGDLGYHDVAALVPILLGAGLSVSDEKGEALTFPETKIQHEYRILAAPSGVHQLALNKIREGVPECANSFKAYGDIQGGYARKFATKS